jgi:hypothetical protein
LQFVTLKNAVFTLNSAKKNYLISFLYIIRLIMAIQKICLGVEISQDWLKIALVEPAHKRIIKVDVIPTSGNSIEDVSIYASVLGSWARSNLLTKSNSIAVAFPACNGIMRLVSIPKDVESVFEYVNWEFEYSTDFKANDYYLDMFFYPNGNKPERAVVTAIRKRLRNSFCSEELRELGYAPNCLMADVCALLNLLEASEGLGSQPKCILKADEKFIVAFWGNEKGPLAIRFLPMGSASPKIVVDLLNSGYEEFPKAKRYVKLCGTFLENDSFVTELTSEAKGLRQSINVQIWNSLSKFSLDKTGNFSKLSQCLGAIGAAISCV